jgi:LPS export ABC transporter protein LptC
MRVRSLHLGRIALYLVLAVSLPSGSLAATSGEAGSTSPEMVLRQVSIVETRAGLALWEVQADQVEVLDRDGITILSRVTKPIQVVFHSPQGQVTCQANRATLDMRTKDVRLEGAVVARSDQGTEVKTESLRWVAASRRLLTDQAVTISRGALVSHGRGMEAETDLERVRIFENITSQVGRVTAAPGRSRHP